MSVLPPTPPDVILVEQFWQVQETEVKTTHYLFAPIVAPLTAVELNDIATQWIFLVQSDFLRAVASDVTCSLLRLSTEGIAPARFVDEPAPNVGAVPGDSAAINSCAVMTWYTQERRDGHAHAFMPLPRVHIASDRSKLSEIGWAETARGAHDAVLHAATIVSPSMATCLLGTVHRRRNGIPLSVAQFAPFDTGTASLHIGTLRRRTHARRQSPPIT